MKRRRRDSEFPAAPAAAMTLGLMSRAVGPSDKGGAQSRSALGAPVVPGRAVESEKSEGSAEEEYSSSDGGSEDREDGSDEDNGSDDEDSKDDSEDDRM